MLALRLSEQWFSVEKNIYRLDRIQTHVEAGTRQPLVVAINKRYLISFSFIRIIGRNNVSKYLFHDLW